MRVKLATLDLIALRRIEDALNGITWDARQKALLRHYLTITSRENASRTMTSSLLSDDDFLSLSQ